MSGLHFHDLRGSRATWAAMGGATMREPMGRLGHTTPNVALRYQHAAAERDRAIAERLDVLMRAAQTAVPEPIAKVVSIERQRNTIARWLHVARLRTAARRLERQTRMSGAVSEGGSSHIRHARPSRIWPLDQEFFLSSTRLRRGMRGSK